MFNNTLIFYRIKSNLLNLAFHYFASSCFFPSISHHSLHHHQTFSQGHPAFPHCSDFKMVLLLKFSLSYLHMDKSFMYLKVSSNKSFPLKMSPIPLNWLYPPRFLSNPTVFSCCLCYVSWSNYISLYSQISLFPPPKGLEITFDSLLQVPSQCPSTMLCTWVFHKCECTIRLSMKQWLRVRLWTQSQSHAILVKLTHTL